MKGRIIAGLFLCSLFVVVGGDAQSRVALDKPVWTLEFIQVNSAKFAGAMAYLDDDWMRVRAEAKKEGAVVDYHRIQSTASARLLGNSRSLVLMTEYRNLAALENREKQFASIRERLLKSTPGLLKPQGAKPEDFYEIVDSQVFIEEPELSGGFKLLAKNPSGRHLQAFF